MLKKRIKLNGLPVSPGIAIGKIFLIGTSHLSDKTKIKHKDIKPELARFEEALEITRKDLREIEQRVKSDIGQHEAEIFEVQLLITRDPHFLSQVQQKVAVDLKNITWAVEEALEETISSMQKIEDPFLRERYYDLRDVGNRILTNLLQTQRETFFDQNEDIIVAADTLVPSQTVNLKNDRIKGFITERGGATGHAAILARSLGVPLVSGILGISELATLGATAIVDGFRGEVFINPSRERILRYENARQAAIRREQEAEKLATLPSVTKDKVPIHLLANIGSQEDIKNALRVGAEGVGLYRTELHFMNRENFASEEAQYQDYKSIAEKFYPNPVVIRTLDLGGDKYLTGASYYREPNPNLGLRAIRISLRQPDMFRTQLRAIFRAATVGNIKLLLPMVSSLEEVYACKEIIRSVLEELRESGHEFNENVPLGLMIEIPSSAINIEFFLQNVDFVSVGTNDLIQYTLAVDRGNESVSSLYQPFHPAILALLAKVGRTAEKMNKEASVCGEVAADPLYTELLVGFGYRHLSMSAPFIPHVKMRVRQLHIDKAKEIAQQALEFTSSNQIRRFVEQHLHNFKFGQT